LLDFCKTTGNHKTKLMWHQHHEEKEHWHPLCTMCTCKLPAGFLQIRGNLDIIFHLNIIHTIMYH
jgi:hypothetical protein